MVKLEKFYKFINTVLIVTILSIEGLIVEKLRESKLENIWILLVTSIILLIAIFKTLEWLIEKAVENFEWIRKLILHKDFIEGTWIDVVEIDGKKHCALLVINFENNMYLTTGEQFCDRGYTQNSWKTIISTYENNSLRTIYQTTYFDDKIVEEPFGLSIYNFAKRQHHSYPVTFSGSFYDMSKSMLTKSFYGFKVAKKETLNSLQDPETKKQTILALLKSEYFK